MRSLVKKYRMTLYLLFVVLTAESVTNLERNLRYGLFSQALITLKERNLGMKNCLFPSCHTQYRVDASLFSDLHICYIAYSLYMFSPPIFEGTLSY